MDLSHQSITGRQFELNRRGYDPDTVDSHLAEIAAAVAAKESRLAELETLVVALQAKVQDADESEEALRLTLKAAAHAKQELLAGAREQVKNMEGEAAVKADVVIGQAEAKAKELTDGAAAQAASIKQGASVQAQKVAKAALAESEALVHRIEGLRQHLATAEAALDALGAVSAPGLIEARDALETAMNAARKTVENPAVLEAAAAVPSPEPIAPSSEPTAQDEPAEPQPQPSPAAEEPQPEQSQVSAAQEQAPEEPSAGPPSDDEPQTGDSPVVEEPQETAAPGMPTEAAESEADGPHLEVVEAGESTADISDKVDRLLEELREVT